MFKNIVWDIIGKFGGQIVSFIISILLTRLLTPAQYGVMGMALVVISFAGVFLELGFNSAIIQQKEVSPVQYSTVFYLNAGIGLLLMAICYFLAGPLSNFYHQPLIRPVFRALSFTFLFNGLNLIPAALLYKRMHFKVNSILSLSASVVSGTIGVLLAYRGFGVWSLVVQSLVSGFLLLVLTFLYTGWRPILAFSLPSIKPLWKYGSRLFASGILETIFTRVDTFIIGKLFTPSMLGYYARAQGMDGLVRQFSANSVMGTLFPYIARNQHDRPFLKEIYVKYLHIVIFVSVGMSGVLFLIAKPLFTLMFTSRWIYSAELFRIMAIGGFAWPASALMCNIISGVGNSAAFLKLEIWKKALFVPIYIFGFLLGLKGFIIAIICGYYVSVMMNAYYVSKEIEISMMQQARIIAGYVVTGAAFGLLTYFIYSRIAVSNLPLTICLYMITFGLFYTIGSFLLRLRGVSVISISYHKLKLAFL